MREAKPRPQHCAGIRQEQTIRKSRQATIANSKSTAFSSDAIQAALEPYGIHAAQDLARSIRLYADLLLLWNQKINLTSVTRPREILERHFGESLYAAHAVPIISGRLADVGSGAGFPGLALKLLRPELSVILIEPSGKKAAFLAEACRELKLSKVNIVRGRSEEIMAMEPLLDYVTARAVGGLDRLLAWSAGALVRQGRTVLWLGEDDARKVSEAPGWSWQQPIPIPLSRRRVLLVGTRA